MKNKAFKKERRTKTGVYAIGEGTPLESNKSLWRNDDSPAREQERHASVWRTMHREHQRTGRPLQGPRQLPQRVPLAQALAQLQAALVRLRREALQHGAALNVQRHDTEKEQERDRGMSW